MPGGAADQPWIRGSPDRIASAVVSPSKRSVNDGRELDSGPGRDEGGSAPDGEIL